jgi:hypothetical protein
VGADKVAAVWGGILNRLRQLKGLARDFEVIDAVTRSIAAAGAPEWAKQLKVEKAFADDPILSSAWREAWDHAAADANLTLIDARQKTTKLANDRDNAEKQCRKLFGEIVRERTFYQLDRRLSPRDQGSAGRICSCSGEDRQGDGQNSLDAPTYRA